MVGPSVPPLIFLGERLSLFFIFPFPAPIWAMTWALLFLTLGRRLVVVSAEFCPVGSHSVFLPPSCPVLLGIGFFSPARSPFVDQHHVIPAPFSLSPCFPLICFFFYEGRPNRFDRFSLPLPACRHVHQRLRSDVIRWSSSRGCAPTCNPYFLLPRDSRAHCLETCFPQFSCLSLSPFERLSNSEESLQRLPLVFLPAILSAYLPLEGLCVGSFFGPGPPTPPRPGQFGPALHPAFRLLGPLPPSCLNRVAH